MYPKVGIRPTIDGRRKGIRESLEVQTMDMAKAAARLISRNLRYTDGTPVQCVIADTTIGGVAEAAACADKFHLENVAVTLTVTPCWCYGSETMDMDPHTIKAIWGFNGTERPGAVYLAAVLAAHSQKGLPAFGIYGHDVQNADEKKITDDVAEKILRFARAGIAAAQMRGKSYLSIGSVAMGIAGSILEPDFYEKHLGMRCESVDMTEIIRRVNENIYDPAEYKKALAWSVKNCKIGKDVYNGKKGLSKQRTKETFEYCVKMAMIARDLMVGNEYLREHGFIEEGMGHNAILAGFQGQR
ncbi:MAG: L-fucose isomerase, partial [Lentisphaeria bacterium]|nr:L-fucose isomerase [Lentisphaeria bacterium]